MTIPDPLQRYGWTAARQEEFSTLEESDRLAAGRVCLATRNYLQLLTHNGEVMVRLPGRFRHKRASRSQLPVVGDWVAFLPGSATGQGTVRHILERRTVMIRQAPGHGESPQDQAIAANVDTVFIVTGLDRDYNLRRIERYLALVHSSGARPVLVLNKLDLCPDPAGVVAEVAGIAADVDVHLVSALDQATTGCLQGYLGPGETVACVGSSGAGKSTLINALLGYERQTTAAVSDAVGKGTHTTTHRELIPLPKAGMLIDTPGMRELQLQVDASDLEATFDEIGRLACSCRFNDCSHLSEPGCAVKEAVAAGEVSDQRYRSFLKLQKEIREREQRQALGPAGSEKERWKPISKAQKKRKKDGWFADDEF